MRVEVKLGSDLVGYCLMKGFFIISPKKDKEIAHKSIYTENTKSCSQYSPIPLG